MKISYTSSDVHQKKSSSKKKTEASQEKAERKAGKRSIYRIYGKLPHALVWFKMILLLCGTAQINTSQAQSILQAHKLKSSIVLDGKVDESEWGMIPVIQLSQKVPIAGDPPTQLTEMRMAYDAEYLYLSGRMYDREPDKIVANIKKRDDFSENSEWFGLLIDSYNDRENALAFYVTPTGAKLDMSLSNDVQGFNDFNLSWNSYWDAAAEITPEGWFAEIRIPWTTLPFELKENQAIMGITAWRYLARNDETDIFPARDLSTGSSFRPSLTQRFAFSDIKEKKPIHITPYLLGGMAQSHAYLANPESYPRVRDFKTELGLDAKIALSSNATLDISINTDFAQVEADDQQVNLSRLNLFFPEKRLFFQERAGLFDFNFGSYDKVFHSRRIGIVQGEQTRIYGGVRAVGKFGSWEGGFLSMQTEAHADLNTENFTVFRVRKRILNENSTLGMIFTRRGDFRGDVNAVYGVDGTLRFLPQNFLSFRWAQSVQDGVDHEPTSLHGTKYYVEVAKRSQKGLTYNLNFGRAGKDYVPGIGFEHRHDFKKLGLQLSYNMFPSRESSLSQYGPYLFGDMTWGNTNKILESQFLHVGYNVLSKMGFSYDVRLQMETEQLLYDLGLTPTLSIAPGLYNFQSLHASISSPTAQKFSYFLNVSTGRFYNGKKSTLILSPAVNLSQDLRVEGNYEVNRLVFPTHQTPVYVQVSRVKTRYTFSTKLTLSAQIQHNNLSQSFLGSLRLRFNPKEGNDFYLVYNGDMNQHRDRRIPWMPLSNSQTIFLKYSHTFHL